MSWSSLLWGRPIVVIATIGLTVLNFVAEHDRPWFWIPVIVLAVFIVIHESVNWWRDQRLEKRFDQNYQLIQERVLRLIADLANLTANRFDLLMIDLYLLLEATAISDHFRNVAKLDRSLSVSLTDVRTVPLEIRMDHELFGVCFSQSNKMLWWDIDLANTTEENVWHGISEKVNTELRSIYGVISVNPIVDRLGKNCRGLLVVHAKRDPVAVTTVVGALKEEEGKRRLDAACQDIHNQIGRGSRRDS